MFLRKLPQVYVNADTEWPLLPHRRTEDLYVSYKVVFVSVQETSCGDFKAVVVEVAGRAFYTGVSSFVQEEDDNLTQGFLLK